MESIWERDVKMPEFSGAEGKHKTDVLIIGGGMTGLLCGYFLKQQGADCVVVEKNRIAGGITKNTTAKITAYQGLIYRKLVKSFGKEGAAGYLAAALAALDMYRVLAKDISCDFEEKNQYIYTLSDKNAIEEEIAAISAIGGKAVYTQHVPIPLPAVCAVKAGGQGQIHPLKFVAEIARDQNIFEHSTAGGVFKEKQGYSVPVYSGGEKKAVFYADRVIMASHFPYIDRRGMYFMKMYQERSYVLALEKAGSADGLCTSGVKGYGSTDGAGSGKAGKADSENSSAFSDGMFIGACAEPGNPLNLSLRTYGNKILFGGGGGRTGTEHPSYEELRSAAGKLYPEHREIAAWAAQDCMSLDGVSYIGPYARGKDGFLVASGFNKWGMTGSMTAAMALTGQLPDELTEIFSPQRTMLRPQLFVNALETLRHFVRPTAPRCSHLGCALQWNRAEKTWDCACHGSSFEESGKAVQGPAQNDLHS